MEPKQKAHFNTDSILLSVTADQKSDICLLESCLTEFRNTKETRLGTKYIEIGALSNDFVKSSTRVANIEDDLAQILLTITGQPETLSKQGRHQHTILLHLNAFSTAHSTADNRLNRIEAAPVAPARKGPVPVPPPASPALSASSVAHLGYPS